jgi:hypothetical protein
MIRLLAHPLLPSLVIKLPLFLSLLVCRKPSLLTGEGSGRGWGRSHLIQLRDSLVLYKAFINLWFQLYLLGKFELQCIESPQGILEGSCSI